MQHAWEREKCIQNFGRKNWEDNIIIDLRGIVREVADWINLA
jgi:hypothetical protein